MKKLLSILVFLPLAAAARDWTAKVVNGSCTISGAMPGDVITIPATAVRHISIKELTGTAKAHIIIRSDKIIMLDLFNPITIRECRYIDFAFENIEIINCGYRAVQITGKYDHCKLSGLKVNGCKDYTFFANHYELYNGIKASMNRWNTFQNITVKNTYNNVFMVGFSFSSCWDYTVFDNINIDSTYYGSAMVLEWNFNIRVRNSTFKNIGLNETAHTAVIFCRGNGRVYNNRFYNIYGNATRWFGLSLLDTGNCDFYKNDVIISRKYPAVEVNTQPADLKNKFCKPVSYLVNENFIVDISASGYTSAAVDLYYSFGKTVISNNDCWGVERLWHNGNSGTARLEAFNNYVRQK